MKANTMNPDQTAPMEAGLIWVHILSHDIASGSDITPDNKIDKPIYFHKTFEAA